MNSYLELVKEYAEKHKRKNRMSLFVILLAVALVATIFGMADMELQTQQISMKKQYGSWHIGIKDMAREQEQIVALRPQVIWKASAVVPVTRFLARTSIFAALTRRWLRNWESIWRRGTGRRRETKP